MSDAEQAQQTWPRTVRITSQPDTDRAVELGEYLDLKRNGLLVGVAADADEADLFPAPPAKPAAAVEDRPAESADGDELVGDGTGEALPDAVEGDNAEREAGPRVLPAQGDEQVAEAVPDARTDSAIAAQHGQAEVDGAQYADTRPLEGPNAGNVPEQTPGKPARKRTKAAASKATDEDKTEGNDAP